MLIQVSFTLDSALLMWLQLLLSGNLLGTETSHAAVRAFMSPCNERRKIHK